MLFNNSLMGTLTIERVKIATKYVDGMENLLYLSEIQKKFQVGLVSVLPEIYLKKLGIIPIGGVKKSMDYILKNLGQRQKWKLLMMAHVYYYGKIEFGRGAHKIASIMTPK